MKRLMIFFALIAGLAAMPSCDSFDSFGENKGDPIDVSKYCWILHRNNTGQAKTMVSAVGINGHGWTIPSGEYTFAYVDGSQRTYVFHSFNDVGEHISTPTTTIYQGQIAIVVFEGSQATGYEIDVSISDAQYYKPMIFEEFTSNVYRQAY